MMLNLFKRAMKCVLSPFPSPIPISDSRQIVRPDVVCSQELVGIYSVYSTLLSNRLSADSRFVYTVAAVERESALFVRHLDG
jgi:hypothetical protein